MMSFYISEKQFSESYIYEGYSESNLRWAVNKTCNEKKNVLYTYNTYILKILLNVLTVGIEALVVSWNKFSYACIKAVCCLWAQPHFDTFHQLIIVEVLWSQNSQLKWTSSARVLAAVCRHALSWRSTTPDVSIPHLLFWMAPCSSFSILQYTSDVTVVPCCMNSTISTHILAKTTIAISCQADYVYLNFFWLVWWMWVYEV
jgi:hypothetical protein